MAKLEEIYEMIGTDFQINDTEIVEETVRSSDLFIKYIQLWSNEKLRLQKLENNKKTLIIKKREYYSGAAPAEEYKKKPFDLKIKTDGALQKYIDSDDEIIAFEEGIIVQRQKVEVLDACVKEIKNRGYQLKNIIEQRKFESGY